MKLSFSLLALLVLISFFSGPQAHAVTLLDKDDWKVNFGGIVEFDAFTDSTRSLTEYIGDAKLDRAGTYAGDNGRTQFSIRNSRFDFDVYAPVVNDWKTRGYIETDFLGLDPTPANGGAVTSDGSFFTSPTLRIRHAYMSGENGDNHVVVGQTWNLFGWQPYFFMASVAVAPYGGMMYERTPQITFVRDIHAGSDTDILQAGLSIVRPTQRDSDVPNVDMGLRMSWGGRRAGMVSGNGETKTLPMSVGISGTFRNFEAASAGGSTTNNQHYEAEAGAFSVALPILATSDLKDPAGTLMLVASYTVGSGYGDEFPNWTGGVGPFFQSTGTANTNLDAGLGGFDSNGAFHLIRLQSFNTELQYHVQTASVLSAGYSQLYSNNLDTLTTSTTGTTNSLSTLYNRSQTVFVNVMQDLTPKMRAGLELAQYRDTFLDGYVQRDNRIVLSGYFFF